ncbi:hypothetical protein [Pseudoblastomonas halimionae]|uniref:Uncharacterized protein n=1 Tax=Alteriqipengyuania halimionae TaxID=1926630 RepID=A0A6I4U2A9_9SPHN|nr:hypothetical protein [Alteriqipengyuania halimionae]MXP09866.1 hypothetical protein [Alteriqipengyuania halimionae]
MTGGGAIWFAGAFAILGVAVLRHSWGRPSRSLLWNGAGWAALALAALLGARSGGAWGVAVTVCVATTVALVFLAGAANERPAWRRSTRKERQSSAKQAEAARSFGARLTTFVVAGPLALVASVLLALAVRVALMAGGTGPANGNTAVLGLVPLVWPLLTFALLMIERRPRQFGLLAIVTALAALPVFTAGAAT